MTASRKTLPSAPDEYKQHETQAPYLQLPDEEDSGAPVPPLEDVQAGKLREALQRAIESDGADQLLVNAQRSRADLADLPQEFQSLANSRRLFLPTSSDQSLDRDMDRYFYKASGWQWLAFAAHNLLTCCIPFLCGSSRFLTVSDVHHHALVNTRTGEPMFLEAGSGLTYVADPFVHNINKTYRLNQAGVFTHQRITIVIVPQEKLCRAEYNGQHIMLAPGVHFYGSMNN